MRQGASHLISTQQQQQLSHYPRYLGYATWTEREICRVGHM